MSRKSIEACHFATLYPGDQYTGTTDVACYGRCLDTQGYEEVMIRLEVGECPANDTLAAAVYENSTQAPGGSVAVTGGGFTTITSSTDLAGRSGSVVCKKLKRYLWLRTVMSATGGNPTIGFGATAILSKAQSEPVSDTPDFDV
jgi:hypothetical protein